jgi:hypothetical protein
MANLTLNIYQKLQAIQSQTGKISKTELNKYQNYRYFTEQQALNILKPLLAEQKLTLTFDDIYEPVNFDEVGGSFTQQKPEKE